jgi:hypothetical protein
MWHRLPTQNRARSMNKKTLTEADIRTKYVTPALVGPNGDKWNVMTQIREEVYFTRGRVIVRGKTVKRGEAKKADYILSYKPNLPLAVLETKDNNHSVGASCSKRWNTLRFSMYPLHIVRMVMRSSSMTAPQLLVLLLAKFRSISSLLPKNFGPAIVLQKA